MSIDLKDLDERIAKAGGGSSFTAIWLADMMSSNVNGMSIPDEVDASVRIIGDGRKFATLGQLLFIKFLEARDPAAAELALQRMDQLRQVASDTDQARQDELDLVGEPSGA